jgi:hypothetical protein
MGLADFPLPVPGAEVLALPAPAPLPGCWAGAPSAAVDADGSLVVAYRIRTPGERGAAIIVARSQDGRQLATVSTLEKARFTAESLERPALVRHEKGWRLYVSCATPNTKHWHIECLEAPDPSRFDQATPRTVLAGSGRMGVKDPVIRRRADQWAAWVCCHPLEQAGEEDRMTTAFATSPDGLSWQWEGAVLSGRPAMWDARGTRVTAVLDDGRASYDGRASKEENFSERTGVARSCSAQAALCSISDRPVSPVRYLDVVPLPAGGFQLFFEMPRENGSHDLCAQRIVAC